MRIFYSYGRLFLASWLFMAGLAMQFVPSAAALERDARWREDLALVDVCLTDDLPRRIDMLPGARFLPPEAIANWARGLPRGQPVVAYCIYGFQVSGEATSLLRQRGFDARCLAGGITAWHAMGGPTVPLAPR